MESTSSEDAMKIVERQQKVWNITQTELIRKPQLGLRGLTPILKEVLLWVGDGIKQHCNATEKNHLWKDELIDAAKFIFVLF